MRIRMLATALVTTGALMGTLTGAANADGTPSPQDDVVLFTCEGGGQVAVRVRKFTGAEIEKMEREGKVPAVPAVPALPSRTEAGEAPGRHGGPVVRVAPEPGASGPEKVRPGSEGADVTVMARPDAAGQAVGPERVRLPLPEPGEAGAPGKRGHLVITEAVPAPGEKGAGAGVRAETKVTLEGGEPVVTCTTRK